MTKEEEIKTNENKLIPINQIERMATAVAKSGLFGVKTVDQALALMLVAQAEGLHPAIAARDYHIIQGKPSKTSDAMLRSFLENGGKVHWHTMDDNCADATFSHPQGGTVRIIWNMNRAKAAGLGAKEMWKKYPRQMLRARTVSEGVRVVFPLANSGMYTPEEVRDFDPPPQKEPKNVTPGPVQQAGMKVRQEAAAKRAEEFEKKKIEEKSTKDESIKQPVRNAVATMELHSILRNRIAKITELTGGIEDKVFQELLGPGSEKAKIEHIRKMTSEKNVNRLELAVKAADEWIRDLEKEQGAK